jgi:hypothetical protein
VHPGPKLLEQAQRAISLPFHQVLLDVTAPRSPDSALFRLLCAVARSVHRERYKV